MDAANHIQKTDFIAELRGRLADARQVLRHKYRESLSAPLQYLEAHCRAVDETLVQYCKLFDLPKNFVICAVGGYGQGIFFPCSDADLLILLESDPTPAERANLEMLISQSWDLGLTISFSTGTIEQILGDAARDISRETALLDARFLYGSRQLFTEFSRRFDLWFQPRDFIVNKLLEMQHRHHKHNNSPFALEPSCKETPGGLRDLQTVDWLVKALRKQNGWAHEDEAAIVRPFTGGLLRRGRDFLYRVRIDTQLLQGKRDDRILFDVQQELAGIFHIAELPYKRACEIMMQKYYLNAQRIFLAVKLFCQNVQHYLLGNHYERVQLDECFDSRGNQLILKSPAAISEHPELLLRAFLMLQQHDHTSEFSVSTQLLLYRKRSLINEQFRNNRANQKLFLQIFQQSSDVFQSLRLMHECGILDAYLPSFRKIAGQMQHDLVHIYTVDQHTLMVIRNLEYFAQSAAASAYPLACQIMQGFNDKWLLYLAALFHDIAKGQNGDHSVLGAEIVREFAVAHNLSQSETDLLGFLVRHHLLMSLTAQKKDIHDPAVVDEFVSEVNSMQKLSALYVLTVADMQATNPRIWTTWRARLLGSLYLTARNRLQRPEADGHSSLLLTTQEDASAQLLQSGLSSNAWGEFWKQMDEAYFVRHDTAEIVWHTKQMMDNHGVTPFVRARYSVEHTALQVMVYTKDSPGICEKIAAFFYYNHYEIIQAQFHTTASGNVLDSFYVSGHKTSRNKAEDVHFIEYYLPEALRADLRSDRAHLAEDIFSRRATRRSLNFPIPPSVSLQPEEQPNCWRLDIALVNSDAFFFAVASLFRKHNIELEFARSIIYGERLEAVFRFIAPFNEACALHNDFEHAIIVTLSRLSPVPTSSNLNQPYVRNL